MTSIAIDRMDGLSSSTAIKGPVAVATTGNIALAGLQVIDGYQTEAGDRVLVKSNDDQRENGIWIADTGPWRRAKDFSNNRDVRKGTLVYVTGGTSGRGFFQVATDDPIVIGTTSISFTRITPGTEDESDIFVTPEMFGAVGDGVADDRAACQAAVDFLAGLGRGDLLAPNDYLLEPVASADGLLNGLVLPFGGFTVDGSIRIIRAGSGRFLAGGDDMVIIRCSRPGTQLLGLDIDGNGFSNVWGIGLIPEDRDQTTTLVSQSFCRVDGCHVHDCAEGLVLEPGPDVGGSQSGAFYPVVTSNHFNLNTRAMWFKESNASPGVALRPTRGNIAYNRIERGNCGIDLEYATEFQLTGNFFQFLKNTYSVTPLANACAIHIGASSENVFVIGGANEASDNYFWNEATLPNALQLLFTPIGAVSIGLSFNPMFESHAIRLTRRTSSYEKLSLTAHQSGFAGVSFDYDGLNVRDANIETNGSRRMSWFNGKTTHYGSSGNIELINTGATINGTAAAGLTVATSGTNVSLIAAAAGLTVGALTVAPTTNNTIDLGNATNRWKEVFAGTGTINTSDAREKDWRGGLSDAEMRVAAALSKVVGIYRWKSSVEAKGDGARLHAGVTVQDVIAAFEAEGLDPMAYGMVCYDEWDDITEPVMETREVEITDADGKPIIDETTGLPHSEPREVDTGKVRIVTPAGNLYGLRYDELWAFVAAGSVARLAAMEARLAALES